VAGQGADLVFIVQPGVNGGAYFVVYATVEHGLQAFEGRSAAVAHTGDGLIAGCGGFDVQPHPIHQRQHLVQPLGVGAAGMKPDLESQLAHGAHCRFQARAHGGFSAAEDNGVNQADTALQQCVDVFPRQRALYCARLQMGVVAVAAAPGASLNENDGRQLAGKVGGRSGSRGPDRWKTWVSR